MRRALSRSLLAIGVLTLSTAASAAPITFVFQGTVDQVTTDPDDPFGGAVAFGTSFSGQYTFDSDAVDGIADGPGGTDGSYASFGAPFGISVDFDGDPFGAFSIDGVIINTRNGSPDQYGAFGFDGSTQISFLLESLFGNPLGDDLLPVLPPALADFESRVFTFRADSLDGNQVEVLGTINSLSLVAVPEPTSLALVSLGLAAAASRRRRSQPAGR